MEYFLFEKINGLFFHFEALDVFGIFVAQKLGYLLIFLLFLFLLIDFRKYFFLPFLALAAGLFARLGVVDFFRNIFFRERPFVQEEILPLFEHEATASFPSGHASFFFAIATIVFLWNRKAGLVFFVGAFLIGLARIFCGIHWPLDILGGFFVGVFSGVLFFVLFLKIKKSPFFKKVKKKFASFWVDI